MPEGERVVLLYVPCGSEEEAARLARALLEDRLIACANVYASRSFYAWKGDVVDEPEQVMVCKTTPSRAAAAEKRVRRLHSYDLPCVLRMEEVEANRDYAAWVREQVAFAGTPGAGPQPVATPLAVEPGGEV